MLLVCLGYLVARPAVERAAAQSDVDREPRHEAKRPDGPVRDLFERRYFFLRARPRGVRALERRRNFVGLWLVLGQIGRRRQRELLRARGQFQDEREGR